MRLCFCSVQICHKIRKLTYSLIIGGSNETLFARSSNSGAHFSWNLMMLCIKWQVVFPSKMRCQW
jgi:hypothetical protein